jgi:hypothetical protein
MPWYVWLIIGICCGVFASVVVALTWAVRNLRPWGD